MKTKKKNIVLCDSTREKEGVQALYEKSAIAPLTGNIDRVPIVEKYHKFLNLPIFILADASIP